MSRQIGWQKEAAAVRGDGQTAIMPSNKSCYSIGDSCAVDTKQARVNLQEFETTRTKEDEYIEMATQHEMMRMKDLRKDDTLLDYTPLDLYVENLGGTSDQRQYMHLMTGDGTGNERKTTTAETNPVDHTEFNDRKTDLISVIMDDMQSYLKDSIELNELLRVTESGYVVSTAETTGMHEKIASMVSDITKTWLQGMEEARKNLECADEGSNGKTKVMQKRDQEREESNPADDVPVNAEESSGKPWQNKSNFKKGNLWGASLQKSLGEENETFVEDNVLEINDFDYDYAYAKMTINGGKKPRGTKNGLECISRSKANQMGQAKLTNKLGANKVQTIAKDVDDLSMDEKSRVRCVKEVKDVSGASTDNRTQQEVIAGQLETDTSPTKAVRQGCKDSTEMTVNYDDADDDADPQAPNKLLDWALQHGHRRKNKARYKVDEDKVYVNSYDEIDDFAATGQASNRSGTCDNQLKYRPSIGFIVVILILFIVTLSILLPKIEN